MCWCGCVRESKKKTRETWHWNVCLSHVVRTLKVKARCHTRCKDAFTACFCLFKEVTLVGSNQRNYLENTNTCSKRTLKTRASQLGLSWSFECVARRRKKKTICIYELAKAKIISANKKTEKKIKTTAKTQKNSPGELIFRKFLIGQIPNNIMHL